MMNWIFTADDKKTHRSDEGKDVEPATPYEASEPVNDDAPVRRGHICCWGLCDMRVAAVILNSANIVFRLICLVFELSWGDWYTTSVDYCSLVLSVIAAFGALNYDFPCTVVATVGHAWFFFVHLIAHASVLLSIFDLFMIYVTFMIAYEIHAGIMTKETYRREEYIEPTTRSYIAKMF